MRRVYFGAGMLVILLGLGILICWGMNRLQLPLTEKLEKAAEEALEGSFSQAVILGEDAKRSWEQQWNLTASLADHAPMDEIDGLFSQLAAYGKQEEATHYAACCRELASLIRAVAEAHELSWWNLL